MRLEIGSCCDQCEVQGRDKREGIPTYVGVSIPFNTPLSYTLLGWARKGRWLFLRLEVVQVHIPVVGAVMMLGLVFAKVFLSRVAANIKDALCIVIQQPKILHVHCSRLLTFNYVVDNDDRCRVFDVNGNGRLGMRNFDKG